VNTTLLWDNFAAYSLQIGLLIGIAAAAPGLFRMRLPGAKLLYWQLLLAACLVLPLMQPWKRAIVAPIDIGVTTKTIATLPAHTPQQRPFPTRQAVLFVLATGVLVRIGWLAVGAYKLRKLRLNSSFHGIHQGSMVMLSSDIASPVTFGWRDPVVLLPVRYLELDGPVQEAILCHELLHVERRDWLFTLAEETVRAIFWYHPAIWWLLGEIQLAREQTVDSLVIERTEAREEYVDALLAIAGAKPQMDLALAPLFLRKRHLKQRVVSILKEVRMSKTTMIPRFVMGVAVVAAGCWIATGVFPLAAAPQLANDAPGVTVDVQGATLLHRSPVSYPVAARNRGVQGTVMVEATLDSSGGVSDAHVVSGPEELRKAALQSVLQWHFAGGAAGTKRTIGIAFQAPTETPGVVGGVAGGVPGGVQGGVLGGVIGSVPTNLSPAETAARLQAMDLEMRRRVELQERAAAQPRTVTKIEVVGLSDSVRSELLARLPVHEGDTMDMQSMARIMSAVREFDEHLVTSTRSNGTETTIRIQAPYAPAPEGSAAVNTAAGGPTLVRKVNPAYPPLAKQARISGEVHLSAIIAADGTVKKLEVISGHPLLVPPALEAVKQWVYQPTLLNGNPVDVKTEITVTFTLSE
jgi:TonB family protein